MVNHHCEPNKLHTLISTVKWKLDSQNYAFAVSVAVTLSDILGRIKCQQRSINIHKYVNPAHMS